MTRCSPATCHCAGSSRRESAGDSGTIWLLCGDIYHCTKILKCESIGGLWYIYIYKEGNNVAHVPLDVRAFDVLVV